MAHTITTQVLESGNKFVVTKYTIAGDAKDGSELTNAVLFDASAYGSKIDNKIYDISYDLNGFSAQLLWDATSKVPAMALAKDHPETTDFINVGGLINNAGSGKTGDILITTNGLASTSGVGYILLRIAWRE